MSFSSPSHSVHTCTILKSILRDGSVEKLALGRRQSRSDVRMVWGQSRMEIFTLAAVSPLGSRVSVQSFSSRFILFFCLLRCSHEILETLSSRAVAGNANVWTLSKRAMCEGSRKLSRFVCWTCSLFLLAFFSLSARLNLISLSVVVVVISKC